MQAYETLEQRWAEFNGLDPAGMVACASGTSAIHLSLEALQLPQGSEVITGDFNMIAVPRAIAMAGLTPVFVDCRENLILDGELLLSENGVSNVVALVAVHIYGRNYDLFGHHLIIAPHMQKLAIIEDLAEAHGVRPHPQTDAACWSFFQNKIIAGAEGGAVWFKNPEHAKLARQLRCLGFTDAHNFMHTPRGHNYRMSNVHAELVLASLAAYKYSDRRCDHCKGKGRHEHLYDDSGGTCGVCSGRGRIENKGNLHARREIEGWYNQHCPTEWKMPPRDAPWVYDTRVPGMTEIQQNWLVQYFNEKLKIPMRHGFKPMSLQPEFRACKQVTSGISRTVIASQQIVYLPISPGITTEKQAELSFEVIGRLVSSS